MKIEDAGLPIKFLDVLKGAGISELNPVQDKAVAKGLLNLDKSFVISAPTASGKTLIAEMMMVSAVLEKGCKAMYVVPLKALASEKYESFKKRYAPLGIRVGISTGDLDSSDSWLQKYDLIILTSEKTDSLLRHHAPWVLDVGVVVIDEVHLINDPGRGPTLEVTITRLRRLNPETRFLFLSATIKNSRDLAKWIGAELVESDWRPVKLYEGIYDGEKVGFLGREGFAVSKEYPPEVSIADTTVRQGKQAIIFASTRRNAESIAERASRIIGRNLNVAERVELSELSKHVGNVLDSPTQQCKRLAKCVAHGVAFHHAGLVAGQRSAIENAFRNKSIKIIAATPTLAAGVDLPAYRVILRDMKRYYSTYGYVYIPVLEYNQMRGRAGRPRYDKEGESIIIAKNTKEAQEVYDRYLCGEPEEIYSKLAVEPILRMHTLALIATGLVKREGDIYNFFAETFYGYQFADLAVIEEKVRAILDELTEWRFIVQTGQDIRPTTIGKRIAELYVDPGTAHNLVEAIEKFNPSFFGMLHLISSSRELGPQLRMREREGPEYAAFVSERGADIMGSVPSEWDYEFEQFMDAFKTAMMFDSWCSEAGEAQICEKFGVAPGELNGKRDIADWLLYACNELALLLGKKDSLKDIRKTRTRVKYGIKEELLPLVALRGIGRVRSRVLFNAGLKRIVDLRDAPVERLESLIGPSVAKSVKEQLV